MKNIIFVIALCCVSSTCVAQRGISISVGVKRAGNQPVYLDSSTVFSIIISNKGKQKILVPDINYEELFFDGVKSFFHVYVYRIYTDSVDKVGVQKNRLGDPVITIPSKDSLAIKVNTLKQNKKIIYNLKLLRGLNLPKGKYYLRVEFATPEEIEVLLNEFYSVQSHKFHFAIK